MEHTETVALLPGTVTISTAEYAKLLQRSAFLDVLLAAEKNSYDSQSDAVLSVVKKLTQVDTAQSIGEGEYHA